jgi:hypothetical protein
MLAPTRQAQRKCNPPGCSCGNLSGRRSAFAPMGACGATLCHPFASQLGPRGFHRPLGLNRLGKRTRRRRHRAQSASRLFRGEPLFTRQPAVLNLLYIDLDAVSEFAGLKTAEMEETIDRLRRQDLFDYLGVPHGEMARSREGLQDLLHIVNARAAERPRMLSRTR